MVAVVRERPPNHQQALHVSSLLTARWYRMGRFPAAMMYEPETIIRLLNKAKIKFIVMGTHGIVGWRSEPRATGDVDILTAFKDYNQAVRVIHSAFPELEIGDWKIVTRFRDKETGNVVIDIMKPVDDLFRAAFRYTVPVGKTHCVPDLELALASKFAAMVSPYRDYDKKLIDGGDFANIVKHRRQDIDLKKLKRLADKVYKGGGKEIAKMVSELGAGRPIKF